MQVYQQSTNCPHSRQTLASSTAAQFSLSSPTERHLPGAR